MELWEMTFKQYKEYLLENSKYKEMYKLKPILWQQREREHFIQWESILLTRAEVDVIPSDVLMSYVRQTSEGELFRRFRGVTSKGIQNFRIPKSIRDLRQEEISK